MCVLILFVRFDWLLSWVILCRSFCSDNSVTIPIAFSLDISQCINRSNAIHQLQFELLSVGICNSKFAYSFELMADSIYICMFCRLYMRSMPIIKRLTQIVFCIFHTISTAQTWNWPIYLKFASVPLHKSRIVEAAWKIWLEINVFAQPFYWYILMVSVDDAYVNLSHRPVRKQFTVFFLYSSSERTCLNLSLLLSLARSLTINSL